MGLHSWQDSLPSSVLSNVQNNPTVQKLSTIPTRHKTVDRNKNTAKPRRSKTAVSCGNPSNQWRKRWANSHSGGGSQFSVGCLGWAPRQCSTDGERADGWWETFVVQHSNPSKPPEPFFNTARTFRGHKGGIKDTQVLQLYSSISGQDIFNEVIPEIACIWTTNISLLAYF